MGDEGDKKRRRIARPYEYSWRKLDGTYGGHRRFATLRKRDAFAREVLDAHAAGRDWHPPRAAASLTDMMLAYLEDSVRTCAEATVANRRDQLKLFSDWVAVRFGRGDVDATVLSRALLEQYDHHLATVGHRKPLEASSRQTVIGIVHGFWSWAAQRDEFDGLVPMPKRIAQQAPQHASVHAPTWAAVDRMIGQLELEAYRRAAVLQRFLGLRIRQVCRLEVADFDFAAGLFHFRGALGKTKLEKRGRLLPIPPALMAEMAGWSLRAGPLVKCSVGTVRRAMRAAWIASGEQGVYFARRPTHAIRKAFRSELRRARCESDALEYWCGRRMGGQTDDYTDPRSLHLVEIATAIPPLASCAQGAPLARLMCWPTGPGAA